MPIDNRPNQFRWRPSTPTIIYREGIKKPVFETQPLTNQTPTPFFLYLYFSLQFLLGTVNTYTFPLIILFSSNLVRSTGPGNVQTEKLLNFVWGGKWKKCNIKGVKWNKILAYGNPNSHLGVLLISSEILSLQLFGHKFLSPFPLFCKSPNPPISSQFLYFPYL